MTYIPTIANARLAADAVTTGKILDATITGADIAASTIAGSNIAADTITGANIAAATITSSELAADSVTATHIAADAVGTSEIAADAVTSAEIATGAVGSTEIAADAVTATHIAAGAVGASEIADGTITDTEVAAANKDGLVAVPSLRTLGFGAQQAMPGDSTLDEVANPVADIDMDGFKVTDLGAPSLSSDAATKGYVDAIAAGLVDYKASVRVATDAALPAYTRTGNVITASANGALAAVDGVTLVVGDRLLLKNGAAGADNGIYEVTDLGSAGTPYVLTRTADADSSAEVTAGMYLASTEGTANSDSVWLLATNDPIVLNTTALSFIELPTVNDLVAGNGLTKTGNTLDVGAGTGISVAADTVAIDTAVVPRLGVTNAFTGANTFSGLMTVSNVLTMSSAPIRFARTSHAGTGVNVLLVTDSGPNLIGVTTVGGSTEIRLPAAHTTGQWFNIKDEGGAAATNNITITTADADTIDGANDYVMAQNRESITVYSDGTNWHIW